MAARAAASRWLCTTVWLHSIRGRLLATSVVIACVAFPVFAWSEDPDGEGHVEEVVVTASPPERGKPPSLEFLTEVYGNRRSGSRLYRRGEHAESFPYLLVAAQRGFKVAQARVSFCTNGGLGTQRDPFAAIAFLGLAAKPPTHPEIRRRFDRIWDRLPPGLKPRLVRLINQYDARFGAKANRVSCDLRATTGTHFRTLKCNFMDECDLYALTGLTPELRSCPAYFAERFRASQ